MVPGIEHAVLSGASAAAAHAEWEALRAETDPNLRAEGLLNLAERQEANGSLQTAAQLYQLLAESGGGDSYTSTLRDRARQRLDTMRGRGSSGARVEFLLRRFAQEAADPSMLLAMGLAGAAFRVTRLATMSRLALSPTANFFTRGFGARAVAGLAGFAVEAPVFTLGGRLANTALGREQDWSSAALGRDLASSYLVLGGLKLAGWASGAAYQSVARPSAAALGNRGGSFLPILFQQAGMFSGILLGHGLEQWVGLRPPVDGATTLVDSLSLLLQFHVAGRLTRAAFGERFNRWERGLDLHAESLAMQPRPRATHRFGVPTLAMAMVGVPNGVEPGSGVESFPCPRSDLPPEAAEEPRPTLFSPPSLEPPPDRLRSYPPEIDALLTEAETRMRTPDYLQGDRAALLAKRVNPAAIDRILFQQMLDLADQLPFVKVTAVDAESLRGSLNPDQRDPDGELLDRALDALPKGEAEDPVSRRVLEIRFPRKNLEPMIFEARSSADRSIVTLSTLLEAQQRTKYRVQFVSEEGDEVVARLPSMSLFEKLLQGAFGEQAVQFHFVDGEIPRDDVMRLRALRVSPIGITRHQLILGDIRAWVFPIAFTIHDGFFHGADDADAVSAFREFSGKLYQWIGRQPVDPVVANSMQDILSDGGLSSAQAFSSSAIGLQTACAFHDALERILREPDPYRRRVELRELHRLSTELTSLVLSHNRPRRGMEPNTLRFLRDFRVLGRRIDQIYHSQNIYYTPEMRPVVAAVERAKAQPGYMEGTREELLAKRVNIFLADRLWFYQARDFAGRVPDIEVRELDAAELLQPNPQNGNVPDRELIAGALADLDRVAPAGSEHRRVLEISFPLSSLYLEDLYAKDPSLRFLATMPFVQFLGQDLNDRVSLMYGNGEDRVTMRIPSLSLTERLIQGVHGEDHAQFHFVSGEIPRDDAMRLRGMRVSVVGLTASSHYFSEFEGEIHPFTFTQHDAFEHAPKEASVQSGFPEFASRLYFSVRDGFPESVHRHRLLQDLSGLYFPTLLEPEQGTVPNVFSQLLVGRLRQSMSGSRNWGPETAPRNWSEVAGFAEAGLRLNFPELAADPRRLQNPFRSILTEARRRAAASESRAP